MNKSDINEILLKHKKWLNDETGGERANLRGADIQNADLRNADLRGADIQNADLRGADIQNADLQRANLRNADLRGANLRGADLQGANLDYSCFPLWCGSLRAHFDNQQMTQLLYHLLRNVKYSKNVSGRLKNVLLTDEIIDLANEFHRVDECGIIKK